jgi:superfamily II DNA or RNA helicase
MTEYVPVYPSKDDPLFTEKLAMMEDFGIFKIPPHKTFESSEEFKKTAETLCKFEKTYYQHFVSQYISTRGPYNSVLLYHGLGSGKTCSAITIAETFLKQHLLYEEPTVWVISKKALEQSFEQEIFRTILLTTPEFIKEQCTGDSYYNMIPDHNKLTQKKVIKRIHKIIKSRYKFIGYDKFANIIEEGQEIIENKVIIIDEAHNIRNGSGKKEKKIIKPLLRFIKESKNNKLVFLSATPMFNEPEEILWLTGLLMLNDKVDPPFNMLNVPSFYTENNKPKPEMFKIIKTLSSKYISYVRGSNPFTFAVRIKASLLTDIKVLKSVPKLGFKGVEIPKDEHNWLDSIKDDLVPSILSGIQLQYLKDLQHNTDSDDDEHYDIEDENEKQSGIAKLRQINNITYIKKLTKTTSEFVEGKDGLFSVFKRTENGDQFEYINPEEPILDPAFGKLKSHSTKFQTLYELLQKSKGLVVIYSNFVWGGILPLSIMLEHMGMSRFGEVDMLNMRKKVTKRAPLDGTDYCILSGENEKDVMGTSKIDDLLRIINDPERNKNIKVVLMSPVASEGLTFKSVREIHILDPWYHLKTSEQAIGRAIRHCSHSTLPIEERNVSVFLHTTVFPDNKRETEDLHAYRLSAMKNYQIVSVDKVIKENALDCTLMENANYFPKEMFDFTTVLKTSHGTSILYKYGDENGEVKCANVEKVPRELRAFHKESYESFIPTLQLKLQKFLKKNLLENNVIEYVYEDLLPMIHSNKEVAHQTLEESLYPYKLWGNYSLLYHYNKFIVTEFKKENLRPTRIQIEIAVPEEKKKPVDKASAFEKLLEKFSEENTEMATLKIYQSIDSNIWKEFARKIVTVSPISPKIQKCIDILESQGAFIKKGELPKLDQSKNNYTGYLNIFANEDDIEGFICQDENNTFRELLPSEILKLKKTRKFISFPEPTKKIIKTTEGIIQRYKNRKAPDSPYIFQFKLIFNNETVKRTGIVCDNNGIKKPEIVKELGDENIKGTIPQLCVRLMYNLLKAKKLWIPVSYK